MIVAAAVSSVAVLVAVGLVGTNAGPYPTSGSVANGPRTAKDRIMKPNSEWKSCLTPEQHRVLRQQETEPAFTGKYYKHHGIGIYACAGCGQELFRSTEKYDSGTGWPSFWKPTDNSAVTRKTDTSLGMIRTEVRCARCGGHLGHVFEDGPEPSGMRYCINSAALDFEKEPAATTDLATATFGAGCFWCTEAAFNTIEGVVSVHNEEQKKAAGVAKAKLRAERKYTQPIVTEIVAASEFHEAEDYHQDYYRNNPDAPYCRLVIAPKLKKLK